MMNKDVLDILCRDHNNRFTEMRDHMSRYNNQIYVLHIYLSIFAGVILYLFSDNSRNAFAVLVEFKGAAYSIIFTFLTVVLYYLISLMMDALFMTYVNGVRMGMIERLINNGFGEDVMVWETKIISDVHGIESWSYGGWIKPNYIVAVWIVFVLVFVTGVLIFLWKIFVIKYIYVYSYIMVLLLFFHMLQWYYLHTKAIDYLVDVSKKASYDDLDSGDPKKDMLSMLAPSTISFITIFFGYLPVLLMSMSLDAFWFDSKYSFPFMKIPSVFIGDLFVVPVINYFIVSFLREYQEYLNEKKKLVVVIVLLFFIVLLIINGLLNSYWVSDSYLGFMDVDYGVLSVAGWWHFGFSVLEEVLISSFLVLFAYMAYNGIGDTIKRLFFVIRLLFVFSLFSIGDLVFKIVFIYKFININMIINESYSFLPLLFAGGMLIFLRNKVFGIFIESKQGVTWERDMK